MLWKWLPAQRRFPAPAELAELVVATARRGQAPRGDAHRPDVADRDAYRGEILGGLADAGEEVLHVFLEGGRRGAPGASMPA